MRYFNLLLVVLLCFVSSCKNDNEQRLLAQQKEQQKNEQIFNAINAAWQFNNLTLNPKAAATLQSWVAWQQFVNELHKKPKSSIGAFQMKSRELSKKAAAFTDAIPPFYDKPEIKTRLIVLQTKVQALDLFIHLSQIPEKKVITTIQDINIEIIALQNQFNELIKKSEIPKEEGEADMIRMLDASRAIPTIK